MVRIEWERANLIGFGLGLGISYEYTRLGSHIVEWAGDGVWQVKDYLATLKLHLGPRNLILRGSWNSPRFFLRA